MLSVIFLLLDDPCFLDGVWARGWLFWEQSVYGGLSRHLVTQPLVIGGLSRHHVIEKRWNTSWKNSLLKAKRLHVGGTNVISLNIHA
jgi:hypothetical protein